MNLIQQRDLMAYCDILMPKLLAMSRKEVLIDPAPLVKEFPDFPLRECINHMFTQKHVEIHGLTVKVELAAEEFYRKTSYIQEHDMQYDRQITKSQADKDEARKLKYEAKTAKWIYWTYWVSFVISIAAFIISLIALSRKP